MTARWQDDFELLFFFKDSPGESSGSPLAAVSRTIGAHFVLADPPEPTLRPFIDAGLKPPEKTKQALLDMSLPTRSGNPRCTRPLPPQSCVWGWWRKPWETHHQLFARLRLATESGAQPRVLLYNQYSRRLYTARLLDVYHEPCLTTVAVPASWADKCPDYYRDSIHLCGAFFVLKIDPKEIDANTLAGRFVDAASFELDPAACAVIPPPPHVASACQAIIDRAPDRPNIRSMDLSRLPWKKESGVTSC